MHLVAVLHKEQLGAKIRARRKELGLSQKGLARLAHVQEPTTVSRWERGITEPEDLGAVARALEYSSVSDLLKGIEQIPEKNRRRMDPDGATQLDRIEHKLGAIIAHFKIDVPDLPTIVSEFERETADTAEPPAAPTPPRRGRRAA